MFRGIRAEMAAIRAPVGDVLVRGPEPPSMMTRAMTRLIRADLIVIDDIGLLPVGPVAGEGLQPG